MVHSKTAKTAQPKRDMYQETTERILAIMEASEIPWRKNWNGSTGSTSRTLRKTDSGLPANYISKLEYRGANIWTLLIVGMLSGYQSRWWMTYNQAKAMGGQVRKGEKGTALIYWNFAKKEVELENGKTEERNIPFMTAFTVFNAAQIDGIEFVDTLPPTLNENDAVVTSEGDAAAFDSIEAAEQLLANMPNAPKTFHNGGDEAFYNALSDTVHLPTRESFFTPDAYYATRFHEVAHATGHPTRLNRLTAAKFGSKEYAREELTAELTAAMLGMVTGIAPKMVENSAAYIQHWSKVLRDDPQAFITAAGKAQHAADYILGKKAAVAEVVVAEHTGETVAA